MKKILFFLFTATIFLATACDKEDEMTTTSTSNNHDILRCKINGEDWTPGGGSSITISPFDLQYYNDTGGLELIASNSTDQASFRGALHFIARNVNLGNNPLIDNESSLYHIKSSDSLQECKYYFDLDSTYNNHVSIVYIDTLDYFMEATFSFFAINDCQDTIRVTEGYFDLNYFF